MADVNINQLFDAIKDMQAQQAGLSQVVLNLAAGGRLAEKSETPLGFAGTAATRQRLRETMPKSPVDVEADEPLAMNYGLLPTYGGTPWSMAELTAPELSTDPSPVSAVPGLVPPLVVKFVSRVDHAALLFASALLNDAESGFAPPAAAKRQAYRNWYEELLDGAIRRAAIVRDALRFAWKPGSSGERAATEAFHLLLDLAPGMNLMLRMLLTHQRRAALGGLATSLDLCAQQVKVLCGLQAELSADTQVTESSDIDSDDRRFAQISASLLERAGGGMSLTAAAQMLGVTRQALHKRIQKGTVLGLMREGELVVPVAQWTRRDGKPTLLPELSKVLAAFSVAGGWSALQFLVEPDPNLGTTPLTALAQGRADDVVHAARAYLGDDEG